jgi:hypothetical protein
MKLEMSSPVKLERASKCPVRRFHVYRLRYTKSPATITTAIFLGLFTLMVT